MDEWGQGAWFDPSVEHTGEAAPQPRQPEPLERTPSEQFGGNDQPTAPFRVQRGLTQPPHGSQQAAAPEDLLPTGMPGAIARDQTEMWQPASMQTSTADAADPQPLVPPQQAVPGTRAGARSPAITRRVSELRRSNPAFRQAPGATPDPYSAPLPDVALGASAFGATMAGGVVQTFSGTALASSGQEQRKRDQKRSRRARIIAAVTGLIAALLLCTCGVLVFAPLLQSPGFAFNPGTRQATETASMPTVGGDGTGATPTATTAAGNANVPPPPNPTPTPNPLGTTVAFTLASQQISSPGKMTGCQSGCDIPGQQYTKQQQFTITNVQSTYFAQTKVTGNITVTNKSNTQSWSVSNYAFTGNGYSCEPQSAFVASLSSQTYPCSVDITSPQSLPPNTISGSVAGTQVTYANPGSLDTNAYYKVTVQDCATAYSNSGGTGTFDQGIVWGTSWINAQKPSGWQLAAAPPAFVGSNASCPQNKQAQYFDASSTTRVSDAAFNPADAQSLALKRLTTQSVPTGYALRSGSATTCSPTTSPWTWNGDPSTGPPPIDIQCADTGLAVYSWSSAMSAQLAASLAGKSKSEALSICNSTAGVGPGGCVITINDGDHATIPSSTGQIKIQASQP